MSKYILGHNHKEGEKIGLNSSYIYVSVNEISENATHVIISNIKYKIIRKLFLQNEVKLELLPIFPRKLRYIDVSYIAVGSKIIEYSIINDAEIKKDELEEFNVLLDGVKTLKACDELLDIINGIKKDMIEKMNNELKK